MKYWFVMLMIAMSIMGCTTTKTETVTVVKNTYVEIPSEFTVACAATAPPTIEEYDPLPTTSKEYLLSMYATTLLQDIALCSSRIVKINEWNKEQIKIFTKQSKEVKDVGPKQSGTVQH